MPDSSLPQAPGPIGIFDSGYGGLTVLREIRALLPQYDYLYLGDNARAPYGGRSFQLVCQFAWECVLHLFRQGCHLVVLACNTASAKALRSIQQCQLPATDPRRRVLGVIRPTAECVGRITRSGHVGVVATSGTILSHTYEMEIAKLWPHVRVTGEACPMWVPLVEHHEYASPGAGYFVAQHLGRLMERDPLIDTLILGCTHYPLLLPVIREKAPQGVQIVAQGGYVARSLAQYLMRHPEMDERITRGGSARFLTTEQGPLFSRHASLFMGYEVEAQHIDL